MLYSIYIFERKKNSGIFRFPWWKRRDSSCKKRVQVASNEKYNSIAYIILGSVFATSIWTKYTENNWTIKKDRANQSRERARKMISRFLVSRDRTKAAPCYIHQTGHWASSYTHIPLYNTRRRVKSEHASFFRKPLLRCSGWFVEAIRTRSCLQQQQHRQ